VSDIRSKAVASALAQIETIRERVLKWDEAASLAEEWLASPERGDLHASASLGWSIGSLQGVCIHIDGLSRTAQVAPVLGWFAKRGLKLKGKPEDYPEIHRRTWDLGDIKILGFFRTGEGAGCRFVEVGKEERPVYKFLCDYAETPEVTA